ncbi:MAG: secondary thiamine-phosphate synthase enzyme YjbQ [Candidatus Cloacimonadia bacterium]
MMNTITVQTTRQFQFIDITEKVREVLKQQEVDNGAAILYVPHTTAGITINERADPAVRQDILSQLNKLIPLNGGYKHLEGNAAAHIKSSLIGCSEVVIIEKEELVLGTWQAIFFCEFDGPRTRKVYVKLIRAEKSR